MSRAFHFIYQHQAWGWLAVGAFILFMIYKVVKRQYD